MIRVLTIDGGGMRGIIPATILVYLELKIQQISKKSTAKIIDYIDFIAGTSTGSITGAAMIVPNEKGKARYSMNNIVDFYIRLAPQMFTVPISYKWKTFLGFIGPLIPEENHERVFLHVFEHYKMKDLIKPAIFPAYDIDQRKVVIYTTNDAEHKYGDFFVKDVMRGTTAVPFVCRPGYFRNGTDIHTIIDGGMIASNPALITMLELFKQEIFPEEIIFISMGTGISKQLYHYKFENAKKWGRFKWFFPIIDITKSAQKEMTSYHLQKSFEIRKHPENYFRIDPPIEYSSRDIFNTSKENIQNIIKDAEEYIEENKEMLDNLAQRLYDCK